MSSLSILLGNITSKLAAINGIRSAYDCPPEEIGPTPFVVAYAESGRTISPFEGSKQDLITIVVEVMVPRKDLARDVARIISFHDDLLNALMNDPTFDGAASTYDVIEWNLGPLMWGEVKTVGYRFKIHGVKVRTNIV